MAFKIIRKLYSIIFGALLTVCLIILPLVFLLKSDLGSSVKIKSWLKQADLYSIVVNNLTTQISDGLNSSNFQVKPNITSSEVDQSVKSAVSQQFFYQTVNSVVDSNYAWLNGQTPKPSFLINLSSVKSSIISNLVSSPSAVAVCNQLVIYRLSTMSACQSNFSNLLSSNATLANYQTINQDNLSSFLNTSSTSKPYYEQYSNLPSRFQLVMKAPLYLLIAVVAILLLSIIVLGFGFRLIKFIFKSLVIATLALIAIRLLVNPLFRSLQKMPIISNNSNSDLILKLMSYFFNDFKNGLNKFLVLYVVFFVILTLLIIVIRFIHKNKKNKTPKNPDTKPISPSQNFIKLNERISQNK